MAPAVSIRPMLAWALVLGLAGALRADVRGEEQARHLAQAENAVWQVLFGQHVVAEAQKQLGKPYVGGAKDGGRGFDCSGLTAFVYGSLGVDLAPNALGQYNQGIAIERASLLPPMPRTISRRLRSAPSSTIRSSSRTPGCSSSRRSMNWSAPLTNSNGSTTAVQSSHRYAA